MTGKRPRSGERAALIQALSTIERLERHLLRAEQRRHEPIAIIGLGCRFPGGGTSDRAFWELLEQERSAIGATPGERWDAGSLYDSDPNAVGKIRTASGAFLPDIDQFDPLFFGISPREATHLDPQHRLLLDVAWEALEDAGQAPDQLLNTAVGVYAGFMHNDYAERMSGRADARNVEGYRGTGMAPSAASGRLSYLLGLQGPSLTVDTACSSSLVAVHLACQSLLSGECQLAIAAGCSLMLTPQMSITLSAMQMLSPDGLCKAFDDAADGFGRGEGCGVVVLKRLSQALADRDRIRAVIRGSAVNHDGPSGGLTVPSGPAQEALIRNALRQAGLAPSDVQYVEAHGTGTSLGDPIEARALAAVFGEGRTAPLQIGSVKTNLGHLEAAAGVAGLIKVVLSLEHELIPAHLHFRHPSRHIAWDDLPLRVTASATAWPRGADPRRAGVSSFGFSGTNAHVIVEEAPAPVMRARPSEAGPHLLVLSAKSGPALADLARRYTDWLPAAHDDWADVCYSAATGRARFSHRLALLAGDVEEGCHKLAAWADGQSPALLWQGTHDPGRRPKLAFVFRDSAPCDLSDLVSKLNRHPAFREAFEQCEQHWPGNILRPLQSLLAKDEEVRQLRQEPCYWQPLQFVAQYAQAQQWRAWGLEPSALYGTGVGELVTACLAGVLSLPEALNLAVLRGEIGPTLSKESGQRSWREACTKLSWAAPQTTLISPATGSVLKGVPDAGTWCRADVSPDADARALEALRAAGCEHLLDIGTDHVSLAAPGPDGTVADDGDLPSPDPRPPTLACLAQLFAAGADVNWQAFYRPVQGKKVALPSYPFQKQRYWPEETTNEPPRESDSLGLNRPMAGKRLRIPSLEADVFESTWSEVGPWRDHRVRGRCVVPASAILEMALSAAVTGNGTKDLCELQDVRLQSAIPLLGTTTTLQLTVSPTNGDQASSEGGTLSWELHALGDGPDGTVRHAVGRILRTNDAAPKPRDLSERQHAASVDVTRFYEGLRRIGLEYGPSFRCIRQLWCDQERQQTYALIEPTDARLFSAGQLAPHLLDACLHSVGAFAELRHTMLPVGFDRVKVFRAPPARLWCIANPTHVGSADRKFDLQICDDTGAVCIDIRGFEVHAVVEDKSTLLESRATSEAWRSWLYDVAWVPCADGDGAYAQGDAESAPAGNIHRIAGHLRAVTGPLGAAAGADQYVQLMPQLERLSEGYIVRALARLGLQWREGTRWDGEPLHQRLSIDPAQHRLFDRLLATLQEAGYLRRDGEGWIVAREPERFDVGALWMQLHEDFPAAATELSLLGRCGEQLADVLRGSRDPLEVLFGGSLNSAEQLYQDSPIGQVVNRLVEEAVAQLAEDRDRTRPWRVLEIGGGTGGTTSYVLPRLPAAEVEYCFTDISTVFTRYAAKKFEDYPFVRYQVLDIEQSPKTQGFEPGSYDLVLASNVLHATRDLSQTLAHARQLLRPGGTLILVEGTAPHTWLDLSFGLTEGWWRFQDHALRPDYPLIDEATWVRLLQTSGFEEAEPVPGVSCQGMQQHLILSRAAREEAKNISSRDRWLIVGDSGGLGRHLAASLNAGNGAAILVTAGEKFQATADACTVNPESRDDWKQLFQHYLPAGTRGRLIFLESLPRMDGASTDLPNAVEGRCESVVHLAQGLGEFGSQVTVWIFTAGAQAVAGTPVSDPGTAALWGLVRAITAEHPEWDWRTVDLEREASPSEHCATIVREVSLATDESNAGYRAGQRWVARLEHRRPVPEDRSRPLASRGLVIERRGSIDGVSLSPRRRRSPGPNEVEVAVYAAGLNFRDVLNVLDLYPGDAGQPGSEFAGVIVAVGDGVSSSRFGEFVMGVGHACCGNFVTTPAAFTVPVPGRLTPYQAAALPVAMLTAAYALNQVARLSSGETVLIHAASGGVGLAAIQWARRCGATVLATAGSQAKREFLAGLGAARVMDSRSPEFANEVMNFTAGRGVDVVLNSLTGDMLARSVEVLADEGRFVEIGKTELWDADRFSRVKPHASYHALALDALMAESADGVQQMLRELADGIDSEQFEPLPIRVFPLEQAESALRTMQRADHIGKLVLQVSDRPVVAGPPIEIRDDGSYLITGGAGGLGLVVAGWLCAAGARHIHLIGRRPLNENLRRHIRQECGDPAADCVTYHQADVSDPDAVARVIERIETALAPLRGVVHAAGTLNDALLENQNRDRLRTVMGPKVGGAWTLHRLTEDREIDFFAMFSSVSALVGSVGQANHAAANAFLDGLASYRRRLGLPATSIDWGAWSEVGAAAGESSVRQLQQRGIGQIDPESGRQAWDYALRQVSPQIAVAPIDWETHLKSAADRPYFSSVRSRGEPAPHAAEAAPSLQPDNAAGALDVANVSRRHLRTLVETKLSQVLDLTPEQLPPPNTPIRDLGLDSLMAVELRNLLGHATGLSLPATLLFDYPTIDALATYFESQLSRHTETDLPAKTVSMPFNDFQAEPIAVVGVGCRFPGGASDADSYWRLLHGGVDAVSEVPRTRWDIDAYYDPDPGKPGKMSTRFGAFLAGVDGFDPEFFGIAAREATSMDPQQRLLMEVVWETLEHAGEAPDRLGGTRTGLFVGMTHCDYAQLGIASGHSEAIDGYMSTGTTLSAAAGRIAYTLGLRGPSLVVDTTCSSSLVATHLAVQSLRRGECDRAFAAGVNLILMPSSSVAISQLRTFAPDGRCKAFDASANGYVRGEGCGVVLLRRLSDAIADGQRILAVIRGSAVNQDGRSGGMTAPHGPAQEEVMRDALRDGAVEASTIDYVEAHGTGTVLGDPIELRALDSVYGENREASEALWIGSVKTNIGHLEASAGVAGLIKTVLALHHGRIPKHLHFHTPNPEFSWEKSSIRVADTEREWPSTASPRRAAVSSFGIIGTNAHLVLEQVPQGGANPKDQGASQTVEVRDRSHHVLTISAQSEMALTQLVEKYVADLCTSEATLADICHTANAGRSHLPYRLTAVGTSVDEIVNELRGVLRGEPSDSVVLGHSDLRHKPRIVFLFPGQGSRYAEMGRGLYETEPVFRRSFQRCDALMSETCGRSLLDLIFGAKQHDLGLQSNAQPAIFSLQYALAELWKSWGVVPDAVIGHSIGECTAACIAGALTLHDAFRLVVARGQLMQELVPPGRIASIVASEDQVREVLDALDHPVSIAAFNGPESIAISGGESDVAEALKVFESRGLRTKLLDVSHAGHCECVTPMLEPFEAAIDGLGYRPLAIPLICNETGTALSPGQRMDAGYWRRQLRQPVRFREAIIDVCQQGFDTFLELGPGGGLTEVGQTCAPGHSGCWVPSLDRDLSDGAAIAHALARLEMRGAGIDWQSYDRERVRKIVTLPTYPFQRDRYWLHSDVTPPDHGAAEPDAVELARRYTYELAWQDAAYPLDTCVLPDSVLILSDSSGIGEALARAWIAQDIECTVATAGPAFRRDGDGRFELDVANRDHVERLLAALPAAESLTVIYVENLGPEPDEIDLRACARQYVAPALTVLQTTVKHAAPKTRVWLATLGAQFVQPGQTTAVPLASSVWGMARSFASEHAECFGGIVDLDPSATPAKNSQALKSIVEANSSGEWAFRDGRWFELRLTPITSSDRQTEFALREDATYLITGGLGGLGLETARYLASLGARHLVLASRGAPSPAQSAVLDELRAAGVSVETPALDVSDFKAVHALIASLDSERTPLRGIVHAAGTIRDAVLLRQDWAFFDQVFAAKVQGSWNLHRAAADRLLDFFVMYSSAASILGPAGQANHAAACAFQGALAEFRRESGEPALSVHWGAWDTAGGASDAKIASHLERQGLRYLRPDRAFQCLTQLLQWRTTAATVMDIDWQVYLDRRKEQVARRFAAFAPLKLTAGADPHASREELVSEWRNAREDQKEGLLTGWIQDQLKAVLRMPGHKKPSLRVGFFDLGMDSLMALDLKNRLQRMFGLDVPTSALFDHPTVYELAAHLRPQLDEAVGIFSDMAHSNGEHHDDCLDDILDGVEEIPATNGHLGGDFAHLSDEELAALVQQRLQTLNRKM